MRIYTSYQEVISETTREVYEMGIRVNTKTMQDKHVEGDPRYQTLELMGYSYMLNCHFVRRDDIKATVPALWDYILQEHSDRVAETPSNPGKSWTLRPEVWEPFLEESGKFSYTYSERMWTLRRAIDRLREDPGSRQVVVPIYGAHPDCLRWGKRRVPCSMHYQFMLRNDWLNLVYVMRSCDIHTHFPVDVALAILLLGWVASELGVLVGNLYHQIGSLHVYRKDAQEGIF